MMKCVKLPNNALKAMQPGQRGKVSDVPLLHPRGLFFVWWPSFLHSFISAVSSKVKD